MFYFHPIIMVTSTIIGLYVLYMGWLRFSATKFGQKVIFPWARHVKLGRVVIVMWLLGISVAVIYLSSNGIFELSPHAVGGFMFIPVAVFIFITGQGLSKPTRNEKRSVMAIRHGLVGSIIALWAIAQCVSGAIIMFG